MPVTLQSHRTRPYSYSTSSYSPTFIFTTSRCTICKSSYSTHSCSFTTNSTSSFSKSCGSTFLHKSLSTKIGSSPVSSIQSDPNSTYSSFHNLLQATPNVLTPYPPNQLSKSGGPPPFIAAQPHLNHTMIRTGSLPNISSHWNAPPSQQINNQVNQTYVESGNIVFTYCSTKRKCVAISFRGAIGKNYVASILIDLDYIHPILILPCRHWINKHREKIMNESLIPQFLLVLVEN